jgi:hypothetical protein
VPGGIRTRGCRTAAQRANHAAPYEVNSLCTAGGGGMVASHEQKTHNIQYRIQNTSETHEPKITNVPLFFYLALGSNDIDGGKSITRAIGRGEP